MGVKMKQEITKSIEEAEKELREKQIEKMRNDIPRNLEIDKNDIDTICKILIEQGYRKQVEAEWIPTMKYYVGLPIYKCSKCNRETETPKKDYYCPNCSAKMKGN